MGRKIGSRHADLSPRTAAVIQAELFNLLLDGEESFGKRNELGSGAVNPMPLPCGLNRVRESSFSNF